MPVIERGMEREFTAGKAAAIAVANYSKSLKLKPLTSLAG